MANPKKPEKSFIEIDPDKLDEEWIGQPVLFHKYARKLADAKDDLARAERVLEVTEAEVELAIRADPAKYGIGKFTEASVKIRVKIHKKVETATESVNQAKHRVDIYQAAVNALSHRKSALESLVTLHGQNYFATPRVKGGTDSVTRDKIQKAELKDRFGHGGKKR